MIGEGVTSYRFTVLSDLSYNIHPTASGDVISGRVLNSSGSAVSGATVTLTFSSGSKIATTTNSKGIYYFRAPANATYTVSATYGTLSSASQSVTLPFSCDTEWTVTGVSGNMMYYQSSGNSMYPGGKLGNKWGVNLTLANSATQTVSLPTALDNTTLTFSTGGSVSWFGQTSKSHDGVDAAKSGAIGHSQSSWLQTTVTGPGTLSFYWNVSCEGSENYPNRDYLSVSIDDEEKARITGTNNSWTQLSYSIPSGSHVVQWLYSKDSSVSSGEDAGYVDQVVWTPAAQPGDAYDPDDDTPEGGTVITPSDSRLTHANHTLSATDKYDFFRVYLSTGYKYVFETTGTMDTYGDIFDSTSLANSVACNDDGGDNRNFKIEFAPSTSGTYYLRVRAYSLGTAGSYALAYQRFVSSDVVTKPDLLPYTPSGWSSPLVVADSNLDKTGATTFSMDDTLYVNWSMICRNADANAVIYSRLYIDGVLATSWYKDKLSKNYYTWVGGYMIGKMTPGNHVLKIVHDATNAVAESNESNNSFETRITVLAGSLPNLKPTNVSVSKTSVMKSEPVVVHWKIANLGNGQAAKSRVSVKVYKGSGTYQSKLVKTVWLDCAALAAGASRSYKTSINFKSFGTGTYSIVISADAKSSVSESSETDNSVSTTVYVTSNISTMSTTRLDWRFHKLRANQPDSFYLSTSLSSKKKATTFKRGQKIYVQLNFWNAKQVGTIGNVYCKIQLNGGGSYTWYWSSLGRGVTGYITNAYRLPYILQNLPVGTYTLTATLDCYDNWWETSEVNNIRRITFKVVEAPAIYGESSFECALNESVSWALTADGSVSAKGLPPGLKYSGGTIHGKATKAGTYTVKLTAKNAAGTRTKTIKIVVKNPGFNVSVRVRGNGATEAVDIANGGTVPMFVGTKQNITVSSTPGKSGVAKSSASSVTVTGLPQGLSYSNGKITGVPTKKGTYAVKMVFKNAIGWSKTFKMNMEVSPLPSFAKGTFNGWSYVMDGESKLAKRKVTVTVSSVGKITATVGTLKFTGTGWTVGSEEVSPGDVREVYCANLRTLRTVGSGKSAKHYTDVISLTLWTDADWTEDQLTGVVGTFSGTVATSDGIAALNGEGASTLSSINADTTFSARRNSYSDNASAMAAARDVASNGLFEVKDEEDRVWQVKVSESGVVVAVESESAISASAVMTVDDVDDDKCRASATFGLPDGALELDIGNIRACELSL